MAHVDSITFFAITETSLYRVAYEPGQLPTVTKMALRPGCHSRIPVDGHLRMGDFVEVGSGGLITYRSPIHRPFALTGSVGCRTPVDNTTGIVGLFMQEEDARRCFGMSGLRMLDPRFCQPTEEVLAAIGDDHPVFAVSPKAFAYPEPTS